MNQSLRINIVAALGEFIGTFFFLLFAFMGTQVANSSIEANIASGHAQHDPNAIYQGPNLAVLYYIATVFAFSLMVTVWVFFRVSGGAFNPAVTFALCLIGQCPWYRGIFVVIAQIVGAIAAAAVVDGLLPGPMPVRTTLSTTPHTSIARGVFIEMFMTCFLILTILMLAIERHRATFLAPIGIGLALFVALLAGMFYTGASLNPARSFGPDVVLGTFNGYHWIYWVGPLLGSLLATVVYRIFKWLDYSLAEDGRRKSRVGTVVTP